MEVEQEQVEEKRLKIEAFEWEAHLVDNFKLHQYINGYTEELSFKNVLQAEKDGLLRRLFLQETREGKFNPRVFGVDLESGALFFQGVWLFLPESGRKYDYRVVYYRRKSFDFAFGRGEHPFVPETKCYLLGWQALVDGVNVQRILFIYPDKNYVELRARR